MRNLKDLISILKELKMLMNDIHNAEIVANDCLQLVKDRIINTGKDRYGVIFSDNTGKTAYSDKKVPIHYYRNKPTRGNNNVKMNKLLKSVGFFASYADWREINNLKTDKVNFQFTGRMWQTTVVSIGSEKGAFVAVFDSYVPDTLDKINNLNDLYPKFMAPSSDELNITSAIYADTIIDFLNQNLR